MAPLEAARLDLGLSVLELWVAYFALGGLKTAGGLGRHLITGGPSTDAIVHALNEAYDDRGAGHRLAYSHI